MALAAVSGPASAEADTDRVLLVKEAVRYCVALLGDGAEPPPSGFVSEPSTGAVTWNAGPPGRKIQIVSSAGDAADLDHACQVIGVGLGLDAELPGWFERSGFVADHGLGYGYWRRTGGDIIVASWPKPENNVFDGGAPVLYVLVRSVKDSD